MRQLRLFDIDNRPEVHQDTDRARKHLESAEPLGDQEMSNAEYAAIQNDPRLDYVRYLRDDYAQNYDMARMWRKFGWHGIADELFAWCEAERARAVSEAEKAAETGASDE